MRHGGPEPTLIEVVKGHWRFLLGCILECSRKHFQQKLEKRYSRFRKKLKKRI